MAESKKSRKKQNSEIENAEATEKEAVSEIDAGQTKLEDYILATGLEDYGRWKTIFKDYERDPNEPPFRRGRIWC